MVGVEPRPELILYVQGIYWRIRTKSQYNDFPRANALSFALCPIEDILSKQARTLQWEGFLWSYRDIGV